MKILAFGDIQVFPHSEWSRNTDGDSTRLLDLCRNTFEWIAEEAERHNVHAVVCMGDVFDRSNPIDVRSLKVVYEGFKSIHRLFWTLIGNHDLYSQDGSIHALSFVDGLGVVSEYPVEVEEIVTGGPYCAFMNYCNDLSQITGAMHEWGMGDVNLVFSHNPLYGYQAGRFSETGGIPCKELCKDLPPYAKVFHGHYHDPDSFVCEGKDGHFIENVIVGAPFSRNFSESFPLGQTPDKGCVIIDWKAEDGTSTYERIRNPYGWIFEEYEASQGTEFLENHLKCVDTSLLHLRVTCTQDKNEIERYKSLLESFDMGGYRIRVRKEEKMKSGSVVGPEEMIDTSQFLVELAGNAKDHGLDVDRALDTGKEILESVR